MGKVVEVKDEDKLVKMRTENGDTFMMKTEVQDTTTGYPTLRETIQRTSPTLVRLHAHIHTCAHTHAVTGTGTGTDIDTDIDTGTNIDTDIGTCTNTQTKTQTHIYHNWRAPSSPMGL